MTSGVYALRWKEAFEAGCAPKIDLESTDEKALDLININDLILHAKKIKYLTSIILI